MLKVFHKFSHTQGNSSSSKHKRDALTYKHMVCLFNSQPLNLKKKVNILAALLDILLSLKRHILD